jgi:prophage regulatory protein
LELMRAWRPIRTKRRIALLPRRVQHVTLKITATGKWRNRMSKTTSEADALRISSMGRDSRIAPSMKSTGSASEPVVRPDPIRMLRLSQVIERTGLGKTSIYELQKNDRFPRSVHLTSHCVRWIDAEVETWLMQQALARIPTQPKKL